MHHEDIQLVWLTFFLLPILLVAAVIVMRLLIRQRQFNQVMEERKLLIEKGMELPPLRLPDERVTRNGHRNLTAGVILLFLAVGLALPRLFQPAHLHRTSSQLNVFGVEVAVLLAALGLALVLLHFILRAYERGERRERDTGPPGETDQ